MEWYNPDRVNRHREIPVEKRDRPELGASHEEANKPVSVAQVVEAADRDEQIYVRREALRDAERHETAEYVPLTVEKAWGQDMARVYSSRTPQTYLVVLTDLKPTLVS